MSDDPSDADAPRDLSRTSHGRPTREQEPPVVARLVVEVRSDGSTTIARGALEDAASGQSVAVEARGESPMQLAWALAKTMVKMPGLARRTVRGLLPGRKR